jgi:hypothetical protein
MRRRDMNEQSASHPAPIPQAQEAKARLAERFGTPPPEPPLRTLTEEDKAAVANVAQSPAPVGGTPASGMEDEVASAAAGLRAMTSDLAETDPEAAKMIEQQAQRLEEIR